ncbi:hypothetical protein G7Z17_g1282 [Cylindrodendrum hubeiense]|uniref:Carrier domain-containing protein n=1 Tax=Cylindrodendrum hubeiense TaxID=595255 RepID=A0A9P5HJQ0_9HYPO|nr:hypothetical protein G7Z17_g1282 [Cylindrodendrum hubeiense]
MNLKDQSFANMTYDYWTSALAPKVEGIKNLYNALQTHELDFLVVFSSVIGVFSNPGQANYAAANSFLDTFVKSIRRTGFPACVIDLAAVGGIGHISQDEIILKRCRQFGTGLLTERDVLQAVESAILEAGSASADEDYNMGRIIAGLEPFSQAIQTAFDSDRRFAALNQADSSLNDSHVAETDAINRWAATVDDNPDILLQQSAPDFLLKEIGRLIQTYSGEADTVDLEEAAGDMSVDSLMAIEIHSWLLKRFHVDVPSVTLAKAKNVRGLTAHVIKALRTKYKLEEPAQA